MPRSIRIEYPGAFYHIMARGNRREDIFSGRGHGNRGQATNLDRIEIG
jgi:REP element-mobilizing transposase RayT